MTQNNGNAAGQMQAVDNDTGEILTIAAPAPMTADQVLERRKVISQVIEKLMVRDVHFGKIPGTTDDSLLKPGADLLMSVFHIAAIPEVEDLSSEYEIRYRVRLRGETMGSGMLVGVGIGEASSNEDKYRWRGCSQTEFDNAGYNARRVKYNYDGTKTTLQVRQNPWNQVNTILKMAKKRASVDFALTALGADEVFDRPGYDDPPTQDDFDDVPPAPTESENPAPATDTAAPVQDSAGNTDDGIVRIRKAADQAGLRDIDVFAQFQVTGWGGFKPEQIPDVLAWIEEVSP